MADITKLSTIYTNSNKCTVLSLLKEVCEEVDNNHTALKDGIDSNATAISNETTARQNADSNLQAQIDKITPSENKYYLHNIYMTLPTENTGLDLYMTLGLTLLLPTKEPLSSATDIIPYTQGVTDRCFVCSGGCYRESRGTMYSVTYLKFNKNGYVTLYYGYAQQLEDFFTTLQFFSCVSDFIDSVQDPEL